MPIVKQERSKPQIHVHLAEPRGFCAGVVRAIDTVIFLIETHGAPVYVRHAIVHNKTVVKSLEDMGAIFVESLDQCPKDRPVVFSAHGVSPQVEQKARDMNLTWVDSTCPLVKKIHKAAERAKDKDMQIVYIGNPKHQESVGTLARTQPDNTFVVTTTNDANNITLDHHTPAVCLVQTTLSVQDTQDIINILMNKHPNLERTNTQDICYATTNRQNALNALTQKTKTILVVGDKTSSNTKALLDTAKRQGAEAHLIETQEDLNNVSWQNKRHIGITAAASAPETVIEDILDTMKTTHTITRHLVRVTQEHQEFRPPAIWTGKTRTGLMKFQKESNTKLL